MKELKKWYMYPRNGIWYVSLIDPVTGKKITAKSTGTNDKLKAEYIASNMYYNPQGAFQILKKSKEDKLISDIIEQLGLEKIVEAISAKLHKKTFELLENISIKNDELIINDYHFFSEKQIATNSHTNSDVLDGLFDNMTFFEYLLYFYDYENSPYIKKLCKLGKEIPNPESFNQKYKFFSNHKSLFDCGLLKDITAEKINTILGNYKTHKKGKKIKSSTLDRLSKELKQPLQFLFDNGFLPQNFIPQITKFSSANELKEIFTQEELRKIFCNDFNSFESEVYLLINRLLIETGCRVGEIQALQISDIIKKNNRYIINVDKNWSRDGNRIKTTKTNRSDFVYISTQLAENLISFYSKQKNTEGGFLFQSLKKINKPISYSSILCNFNKTMKKLGIKRKNLTPHSYRHTYATLLRDAGFSDRELLFLTRHEDIKMLEHYSCHYTETVDENKQKAMSIISSIYT